MEQDPERNKLMVRRWVEEVINGGDLAVIEEIFSVDAAARARRWVAPFRASFSDIEMRTVDLIAERETVAGRFLCSGTHTGDWDSRTRMRQLGLSDQDVDQG